MKRRLGLLLVVLATVAIGACAHHGPRYVEAHYTPGYSVHVGTVYRTHRPVRHYRSHTGHYDSWGRSRHYRYDRYGYHHYPGCGH